MQKGDPVEQLVEQAAELTPDDRQRLIDRLAEGAGSPLVDGSRITSRYGQLLSAVEASRVGVWEWNAITGATSFNAMWYGLLGLDPGELPEEVDSWADLVHPDDKDQTFADLHAYLEGKTDIYLNIHRLRHKDGHWVWIRDCGVVTRRTEEGEPWILIGTHVDVTDLKRLELELMESRRQAEASVDTKNRFLAHVSHELRTPMTCILGLGELLLRTEIDDRQRRWLEAGHRSARNLLGLLDDLVELTLVDSRSIRIDERAFSWSELIGDCVHLAEALANQKSVRFEIEARAEPDVALGDPGLIRQVLTNLISNALKWTRPESTIGVRLRNRAPGRGRQLFELEVEDRGPGIPRQEWQSIFERFRRSPDPGHEGLGLGLTIARRLMIEMGGELAIVASNEDGTVFRATLPARVLPEPGGVAASAAGEDDGLGTEMGSEWARPPRVLVADDDANNRLVFEAMLQMMGCDPILAKDGEQAVRIMTKAQPDAVLMDYEMPQMNGFEATQLSRQRGFTSPVISLSAHVSSQFMVDAQRFGLDEVLSKPFDLDDLESCLYRHLAHLRI